MLKTSDYNFELPTELIAQFPCSQRDQSRILHFIAPEQYQDLHFADIVDLIPANSVLVRNNTRVIPARCFGQKPTGATVEVFLERMMGEHDFLAHVRSNRSLKGGAIVIMGQDKVGNTPLSSSQLAQVQELANQFYQVHYQSLDPATLSSTADSNNTEIANDSAEIYQDQLTALAQQLLQQIQDIIDSSNDRGIPSYIFMCTGRDGDLFKLRLLNQANLLQVLQQIGHIPLPPYMKREDQDSDTERYQTVYAKIPGAVAAPTAGLHFTTEILAKLEQKNVTILELTLHVGAGTFLPVKSDCVALHNMHEEWLEVSPEFCDQLNQALAQKRHIIAVGTTSVRSLETLANYSSKQFYQAAYKKLLPLTSGVYTPIPVTTVADMIPPYQAIKLITNELQPTVTTKQLLDIYNIQALTYSKFRLIADKLEAFYHSCGTIFNQICQLVDPTLSNMPTGLYLYLLHNLAYQEQVNRLLLNSLQAQATGQQLTAEQQQFLAQPCLLDLAGLQTQAQQVASSEIALANQILGVPELVTKVNKLCQASKHEIDSREVLEYFEYMAEMTQHLTTAFINPEFSIYPLSQVLINFGTQVPIVPFTGPTKIFINREVDVQLVDSLITNFHLPKSTLIMLLTAFIPTSEVLHAYNHAVTSKYRFYSYGDSCFIPNRNKQKFNLQYQQLLTQTA